MKTKTVERPTDVETRDSRSDGQLLAQFIASRNQEAFSPLMQRHGPYLFGVCRRVTNHQQDAEDVFQACFLELVRHAAAISRADSVAGWGFQILPHIEGENAWRGGTETTDNARQRQAVAAIFPVFFCPSRRAPTTLLIAEKRLNLYYAGVTNRSDDNEGYTGGNDWDSMRSANLQPGPDTNQPTTELGFAEFGSSMRRLRKSRKSNCRPTIRPTARHTQCRSRPGRRTANGSRSPTKPCCIWSRWI